MLVKMSQYQKHLTSGLSENQFLFYSWSGHSCMKYAICQQQSCKMAQRIIRQKKGKLAHKHLSFINSKSTFHHIILSNQSGSIQIHTRYTYMLLHTLHNMNHAAANRSQDPQHDATIKSESWDGRRSCTSKQKFLRLSMTKSFLPRSISPSKEADALQLAWDILNDKVSLPCFHRSEASLIRDNQNASNHSNDEATETSDHSSSSLS